jgi:hypothetical protein
VVGFYSGQANPAHLWKGDPIPLSAYHPKKISIFVVTAADLFTQAFSLSFSFNI